METITQQVTALATGADEVTRKHILTELRDLSYALESPEDTTLRLQGTNLTLAVVRIGLNLKIFEHLANSASPLTLKELVDLTNADGLLLARILRTLAGYGVIKETGVDEFASTNVSTTLARPGTAGIIKHYFDVVGLLYQATPAYLDKHGYKDLNDAHNTVFQAAHDTTQTPFEWISSRPEAYANFNTYMAARNADQVSWLQNYPVHKDISPTDPNINPERVLFVDVGGGIGHQATDFRAKYKEIPGRVLNQDLAFPIKQAKGIGAPGVEHMVHDIFTPNPIKGAKYYYIREVMHDWPDAKSITILQHLVDAMAEDSLVLVDEMVLPDKGVPWQVMQMDISMMVTFGAMERTEAQWTHIFDTVGLERVRSVVHRPGMLETVTALRRKRGM
ncbi:S-adenosyl-L-methionine-dependent methyltransferase [Polyplosphaeria fusca]|uniref:S-adenosyl-L-methionine-dependent methyltransferase n=1 Tax=Polyplosphaeria fusca TaxID=682080 RepID=A0A9P4QNW7_9PLEO|nr:S-adenosyl-L-methionine-dependent methyltransferase [Polyplosphaeria fusca]